MARIGHLKNVCHPNEEMLRGCCRPEPVIQIGDPACLLVTEAAEWSKANTRRGLNGPALFYG
jgi:hypothetical protein